MRKIVVKGAREHNLKGIDLELPQGAFICFVGPSGSGKSTLVFDVIGREAERRLLEALSPSIRQILGPVRKPEVERIEGLCPPVIITRAQRQYGPRSTVGTATEIYDYLRVLFARAGQPFCPRCERPIRALPRERMVDELLSLDGKRVYILIPIKGGSPERYLREGFTRAVVDGELVELEELTEGMTFDLLVDRLIVRPEERNRMRESLELALRYSSVVKVLVDDREVFLCPDPYCPFCDFRFPSLTPSLFSFNAPEGACPRCNGLGELNGERCPKCGGRRLREEALWVRIGQWDIATLGDLPIRELLVVVDHLRVPPYLKEVLEAICERLDLLRRVGLGYLSLSRPMDSLSEGEIQRVRLSNELAMGLSGVMYLVDEPTVALHPRDQQKVLGILKDLRDQGNTVLVVEHDPETILEADWVVELGPGGGEEGGRVVFTGTPRELLSSDTLTSGYLRRRSPVRIRPRRSPQGWITVKGARRNNLKGISVAFPLGTLCAIGGVSGSGKSTLVSILAEGLRGMKRGSLPYGVDGLEVKGDVQKVVVVDQSPPGRDPRSNPATYTGAFRFIREIFSRTPSARVKGWGPERFSFNIRGGRCEVCKGQGRVRVELGFLPEVFVTCEHCEGTRYEREVLEVKYRGLNIAEVLNMTVNEAIGFFHSVPPVRERLEPLRWVGLGYLKLGQPLSTLSGGEAQRLKMARELVSGPKGTLYILDEPTTGLHPTEVQKLIGLLDRLLDEGASIVVIEHNIDFLLQADYIIELGPGGGDEGGEVVLEGPPEEVLRDPRSSLSGYLWRLKGGS